MKNRLTLSQFIERANRAHGSRYDYSAVRYRNLHDRVTIRCPVHGDFEQKAYSHLQGRGCGACSKTRRGTTAGFIQAALGVHGDRYDYSQAEYRSNKAKVTIVCREHGPFEQVPNSHLAGRGCRRCAKTAYDQSVTGHVYILLDETGRHLKVGISNKPRQRFGELRALTPFAFTVLAVYPMDGACAPVIEKWAHAEGQSAGFSGFCGATEWLKNDLDFEYKVHCAANHAGAYG